MALGIEGPRVDGRRDLRVRDMPARGPRWLVAHRQAIVALLFPEGPFHDVAPSPDLAWAGVRTKAQ
eukprot:3493924-Alexandrium_andersonii.AAC.1